MHRHRELCERAVDPLEIAAGLEAHGVTDRTAARFRHRDVFALAEELFARVPREGGAEPPARPSGVGAPADPAHGLAADPTADIAAGHAPGRPGAAVPLPLLPGVVCVLTLGALALVEGRGARLGIVAGGALGTVLALRAALGSGPLRAPGRTVASTRLLVCWLLGHALFGNALLEELLHGGPDGPPDLDGATAGALAAGLSLAVGPAMWCAGLYSTQARKKLAASRSLDEFAARARPLLVATVLLFTGSLLGLLLAARLWYDADPYLLVQGTCLGVLLYLARLLTVHGHPDSAAGALGAACAVQAAVLAAVPAGLLPGMAFLARPVELAVTAWGPGALPSAACAGAALALLPHALASLSRAFAHAG
ncbi:hypothetical protein GUY61_33915 [Streptomyces sp. GC420]|nr:hypothetical protein [Streptomyces sp. GC420]